jgi:hypothetical protein
MRWRRDVVIVLSLAALLACSSETSPPPPLFDATATSSSTGGSWPGDGGSSGTGPPPGGDELGLACDDDSVCGPGGRCLRPIDDSPLGGGPAGGYCTRACIEDSDCPGLHSLCIRDDVTGAGACFLGCEPGPARDLGNAPLDPDKCRGREDVRCDVALSHPGALLAGTHICLPTCGMDAQCPAGRTCDPRDRVCVTTPHSGLPMGDKCDEEQLCAGYCMEVEDGGGICTSLCVYGGTLGGAADCGGLSSGLCNIRLQAGNGAGDVAVCVPACDEQDDCVHPWFWCKNVLGGIATHGYCSQSIASCRSGICATGTCTETIHGPRCLDPKYPLGSAAPGVGGAGSD